MNLITNLQITCKKTLRLQNTISTSHECLSYAQIEPATRRAGWVWRDDYSTIRALQGFSPHNKTWLRNPLKLELAALVATLPFYWLASLQ